jgi:ubiquinone/menaquinone biosynthesis C-methylase UbiE
MSAADVVWHDVECGGYDADMSLWIALAQDAPEGVLDVGAGTGRVALRLAQTGYDVTALDIDPELLAVLEQRAAEKGVRISTLAADANAFELPHPVGLIAVPMQTIQLLPARDGFFASARRALVPGGRVAVAIATELDAYDGSPPLPVPDFGEDEAGSAFISQPVAIRVYDDYVEIERIRQIVSAAGERTSTVDLIRLAVVTPGELAEEAAVHGLDAEELLHIPETLEHVASQVVVFRG